MTPTRMYLPRTAPPPTAWLDSLLAQNETNGIYVPPAFARTVLLHLAMNYDSQVRGMAPLMMAIVGPFGSGKTATLRETLARLDVHCEVLRAFEFEDRWANVPVERILRAYGKAAERQMIDRQPAAVVVDDIDVAIGFFEQCATGTTNTQHCIAAFMQLADDPTQVNGKHTDRVPVFVTCNDLTKLYGALRRPGRMRVFVWDPSGDDRSAIARHLLQTRITAKQLAWLLVETPSWTVAHFAQLKALLEEQALARKYGNVPPGALLRGLVRQARRAKPVMEPIPDSDLQRAVAEVGAEDAAKVDYTQPAEMEAIG